MLLLSKFYRAPAAIRTSHRGSHLTISVMRYLVTGLLLLASLTVYAASSVVSAPAKAWPDGRVAALSLTYDDALASQLDIAIPELDKRGLSATFYITIESPVFLARSQEWQQAAKNGHELGNHTLIHPCYGSSVIPDRDWITEESDLSNYSVARVVREAKLANDILQMLDQQQRRSFAYPCGDTSAAQTSFIDAIQPLFVAARHGGNQTSLAQRYQLPSYAAVDVDGDAMIDYVKSIMASGTFGSITFHGVGGDYLSVSAQAHRKLLDFLAANKQQLWVATVKEVADYYYAP
ncbi:polysaccharide deacetylase family protein [Arenicella xantha]|uniref:Polysaccharide deacetylase n=1 Tax=Arenicella xantha TaxID=644221 RepID=A0A395JQ44_9GAMM|nr:polysaccharide deacetylase family protein [Arenicella xantha]RBP53771.1 polysaccharide deacetylase [Arenicella xantha]